MNNNLTNLHFPPKILITLLLCLGALLHSNFAQAQSYCSASGNDSDGEWIQRVLIASINNDSGNNGGFGDYTNLSTFLQQGNNYNITLVPGYSGEVFDERWRVWIDLNDDGDFADNNELVYDSDAGEAGEVRASITIPSNANIGETRMRVAMKWVGSYNDGSSDFSAPLSCGTFPYGEVEDYTININSGSTGSGNYCSLVGDNSSDEWIQRVQFSNIDNNSGQNNGYNFFTSPTGQLNKGASTNITLNPGYSGEAYDEYWRIWIDYNQDNDFNDAGELVYDSNGGKVGTVTTSFTVPTTAQNGNTRMRIAMKWVGNFNDGTSDYSPPPACGGFEIGEVEDYTVNIQNTTTPTDNYCVHNGGSTSDEWIQRVNLNGIDNTSGNNGGYANFTNFTGQLSQGNAATISLTPGYLGESFDEYWRVWIDYNQDNDFDDAGELVYDSNGGKVGAITANFTVPNTASIGATRMRVAMKWVGNFDDGTTDLTAPPACGNFNIGEVEDYTVTINNNQSNIEKPIVAFDANTYSGPAPLTVNFSDQSQNNPTAWSWTFNGGNPSSSILQNPTVVYNSPGTYTVTLVATNGAGNAVLTKEAFITVTNGNTNPDAPQAAFVASATTATAPSTITFTDQSTNNPTTWNWVFEGGIPNTSTERNPSVAYNTPGIYTVTLVVTNGAGNDVLTKEAYINITGSAGNEQKPVAAFSSSATIGTAPFVVSFLDQSTNSPTAWNWAFEGGTPATSTERNPVVTFSNPGVYTVTLVASNSAGNDATIQEGYVTVNSTDQNVPPIANFTANQTTGQAPLTVNFTDQSTNSPSSWTWTFEGGSPATSTQQNPVITYNNAGVYRVTLVAANSFGNNTISKEGYIRVESDTPSAPTANFIADKTSGTIPLTVTFNDISTNNPNAWNWVFEGGTPASSTNQNPTITYTTPGVYQVSLTASNAYGNDIEVKNGFITVASGELPPLVSFEASILEGNAPLTVTFFDLSINDPLVWDWKFPGATPAFSSEKNPTVVYENEGTYNVSLTVENNAGSATKDQVGYITVFPFTGLEEGEIAYATVSPNPSSDFFHVTVENPLGQKVQVVLYNTVGQMIQQYLPSQQMSLQYSINAMDLPAGMYYIQLTMDEEQRVYQVMKE